MAVSKLRGIHGIAWVATMCAILAKLYEMRHSTSIVMELGASAQQASRSVVAAMC